MSDPLNRDNIKKSIDEVPESMLSRLIDFIGGLCSKKNTQGETSTSTVHQLPEFDLQGRFDDVDLRAAAYKSEHS
jgi:hypothetical protein